MNQIIDLPNAESSSEAEVPNSFLIKLVCLAGVMLLLAKLSDPWKPQEFIQPTNFIVSLYPHVYAAAQTINNGLLEFSGRVPELVDLRLIVSSLGSLLLAFVIGPTTFFFSIRRYVLTSHHPQFPSLSSLIGMILALPLLVSIIPVSMSQYYASRNLRNIQAIQRVKDDMINGIVYIAQDARSYSMVPNEKGGGGGSYQGFVPSPQLEKTEWATFSVTVAEDGLQIAGTVTKNPSLRFGIGRPEEIPLARVSCTLSRWGDLRNWEYDGIFK